MNTKPTVTIGIPAFNEGTNIARLVNALLQQKMDTFHLKSIVVSSDGSSDNTVSEARKIKSKYLEIIDNKKRMGRAVRQSQMLEASSADIFVLIDGDIVIKDTSCIESIIAPIARKKADLTSASVLELNTHTLMEKLLECSMVLKREIFESYKNGNNIYTCHGRIRAFSKPLYKSIKFTTAIGEDAYSFLYCKRNNFVYKFVKKTNVYYKLPSNFKDHQLQSIRFYQSKNRFYQEFGKEFVKKEYFLPMSSVATSTVKTAFKNPYVIPYVAITVFLKVKSMFFMHLNETWDIATSSKIVIEV